MKTENILFTIIGLLVGLIIGFVATNSYNRQTLVAPGNPAQPSSMMPSNQSHQTAAMPGVNETIEKAEKEPDNFEAQIKAGEMFARIQNYEKALPYFEKADKIKPNDYQLLVLLGNSNFELGNWEVAEKWYEKALAIKNDIAVRTDYGITFIERKAPDYDRAIKEFQTNLGINPNHEATIFNMAVAFHKKGDAQKVQELKKKLSANAELTKKLENVLATN